jgi:ABC-type multidrug transport system fused ATPase/permease subunit
VTRIEADMQAALYGHLIEADLAQLGRESPAALTQRFTTDFAYIRDAMARLSTVFLREVATVAALIVAMLWIDPVLTVVAAVTVPFLAYPIGRIGQKLKRVAQAQQEQIGAVASLLSESFSGARVAKTYALERYLKGRAAKAFDEVRRLKMKAANARGRLDPLLEVGGGAAVAGVLILIGWRHHRRALQRRRFHRVRHGADPRRPAHPHAREPERDRPGGGRGAQAHLRPDGRGAPYRGSRRRGPARHHERRDPVRPGHLRLR